MKKPKRMMIRGLSNDRAGLLVYFAGRRESYWHVHSNEMTPYQRRQHRNLIGA